MEFINPKIELVNEFDKAINMCRDKLTSNEVHEEHTYFYAITRAYSRALLTAFEICSLLKEGYPEGALSLSRSVYEALVIISKLLEGAQKDDKELLKNFFAALTLSHLKCEVESLKWISEKEPSDANIAEYQARKEEFDQLKKEHGIKGNKVDYWWANVQDFTELAKSTPFPKDYMYSRTCANVHFNALGIFQYVDNTEDGILIGETDKGLEIPLWYTALTICTINGMIQELFPELVSEEAILALKKVVFNSRKKIHNNL